MVAYWYLMRVALAFTGMLVLSVSLLLRSLPSSGYRFERLVPSDVLALLVIREPPPSLDFLEDARLRQWIDIDVEALRRRIPSDVRGEIESLLQTDLEMAWILVHSVSQTKGAWKPQFTLVLVPKPFHAELVELRAELLAIKLLGGSEALVAEEGPIKAYYKKTGGRSLFRARMPGFLLVSNTEEGLRKTLRCFSGLDRSIAQSLPFRRVQAHLRFNQGFFLYVDLSEIFPVLPQVGYSVDWVEGEMLDKFYVVPVN
ncbi:MAG: hypothetical protein ACE15E_22890 [Acidobacteriota bacterium]